MRRREDGYHDLASLFHVRLLLSGQVGALELSYVSYMTSFDMQVIDLGDDMEFCRLEGTATADILECSDPTIPSDDSNLVIKALNLFRSKTGIQAYFHVILQKRVPHGAGLGGGSGNAATTLWAANELTGRPATNADLLAWSAAIGSDISVFFSDGAAYCTGRGEIVENVAPPVPLDIPLLLVKPPIGLSTPAIFKALDLNKRSTADPLQLLQQMTASGTISPQLCVNDLEQPAFDTLPELAALKQRLIQEGGSAFQSVFMTGSGSTIVCVGSDRPPAFLREPEYSQVFVCPARLMVRKSGQWYHRSQAAVAAQPAIAA
eukprot:jgi/Chrzof1/2679/Cz11g24270.t1